VDPVGPQLEQLPDLPPSRVGPEVISVVRCRPLRNRWRRDDGGRTGGENRKELAAVRWHHRSPEAESSAHWLPTLVMRGGSMFHAMVNRCRIDASYTAGMFGKYTIAELGALLSDPSRVEILTHVLDGSRHSAGALALAAGLSPQAASAHLTKLTRGGLLRMTRDGRTRLFELSRPEIGHMLEALGAATHARPQGGDGRGSHDAVRMARTCYDHLAANSPFS